MLAMSCTTAGPHGDSLNRFNAEIDGGGEEDVLHLQWSGCGTLAAASWVKHEAK